MSKEINEPQTIPPASVPGYQDQYSNSECFKGKDVPNVVVVIVVIITIDLNDPATESATDDVVVVILRFFVVRYVVGVRFVNTNLNTK